MPNFHGRTSVKPAPISRAESAPPTRGNEAFNKPVPLPPSKQKLPPSKPPVAPTSKNIAETIVKSLPAASLRRPKRMLPRDPMASRCSLAMSRTESLLVSPSGDVRVCRCRRSSTPYLPGKGKYPHAMDPWTEMIPCCDTPECTLNALSPVFETLNVNQQLSADNSTADGSTYEWEKVQNSLPLLGPSKSRSSSNSGPLSSFSSLPLLGSPLQKDTKLSVDTDLDSLAEPSEESLPFMVFTSPRTPDYRPPTEEAMMEVNAYDGGILPLPSFDYDHIHDGQNDMLNLEEAPRSRPKGSSMGGSARSTQRTSSSASSRSKRPTFPMILESPEEKKDEAHTPSGVGEAEQPFYHGVPILLTSLSQIRIKKVSAHPLGAHTLLISEEALLFSYGLNNRGQLGIGIKTSIKGQNRGFHTTPSLITPLLQNGGKVIHCAAGVDHSLVVVATEGRRIHKLNTKSNMTHSEHGLGLDSPMSVGRLFDDNSSSSVTDENEESLTHHQIYGFGSNDMMKLGLVRARLADDGTEGDAEDIVLPRRVALHCNVWPVKGIKGSLGDDDDEGIPHQGIFDIAASSEHSAALVRRATGDVEVYMWGNATLGALGLPISQDADIKIQGGLTQRPRSNAHNIFPLPTVLESLTYRPNRDSPLGFARQISLGPYCSFLVMSSGKCMSFGYSAEGMLGHGVCKHHTMTPTEIAFPALDTKEDGIVTLSAGATHVIALTQRGYAYTWGMESNNRLGRKIVHDFGEHKSVENAPIEDVVTIEWIPRPIGDHKTVHNGVATEESLDLIDVCAGYDSTMVVSKTGRVYSFGKRSGRLGQGEVPDDAEGPASLHGGIRLFYSGTRASDISSRPVARPLLKRLFSDGVFQQRL